MWQWRQRLEWWIYKPSTPETVGKPLKCSGGKEGPYRLQSTALLTLDVILLASRTVRVKLCGFKLPSLWYIHCCSIPSTQTHPVNSSDTSTRQAGNTPGCGPCSLSSCPTRLGRHVDGLDLQPRPGPSHQLKEPPRLRHGFWIYREYLCTPAGGV